MYPYPCDYRPPGNPSERERGGQTRERERARAKAGGGGGGGSNLVMYDCRPSGKS